MPLDIQPLLNAIERLHEGLQRYQQDIRDIQIRDGLVQRFEFTYEISHKTLKRYLEFSSPSPEQFDQMPFADLIRTANEQGLLQGDWPTWRTYRDMRAKTSHTYDEDIALQVVAGIPDFLAEARFLATQLQQRLAHE
ncbi:nucleotidyltransferase substrate binding protein [Alkalimonas delamerensis]|uniref:Nucleotidyltransferase substrate binding protein n=1 Tax=Alkalimonas delamerensis TaxID=265981 RepID=A0ABT9GQF9_9GAMM|nr:nucleotidyltransferase substrate binding protein [Alkalimonas delamerensis]MDP4529189.1 nucleotidyltransferase substrate binding protein [Alkalimonas delamerensis]